MSEGRALITNVRDCHEPFVAVKTASAAHPLPGSPVSFFDDAKMIRAKIAIGKNCWWR
jgi:hypothetical protein